MKFTNVIIILFSITLSCLNQSRADDNIAPFAEQNPFEGYHDIPWGTALASFKSSQKSFTVHGIKQLEVNVIDRVMSAFHSSPKDFIYQCLQIDIEKVAGSHIDHIFYNNQYRLAAQAVPLKDFAQTQKWLEERNNKKAAFTYSTANGQEIMTFNYQQYEHTPKTRIYLVSISSNNNASGIKKKIGGVLIYVSDDYLTSHSNAWTEYQAAQASR